MECTWCGRDIESPGLCERCTLDGFTREEWNARIVRRRWAYGVVWLAILVATLVAWIAWGAIAAVVCVLLVARLCLEGGVTQLFGPFLERKR